MVAVSNSLATGVLEPTALICVPLEIQSPITTGCADEVTVQIISAFSTASFAFFFILIGMLCFPDIFLISIIAFFLFLLQRFICFIFLTNNIASICLSA